MLGGREGVKVPGKRPTKQEPNCLDVGKVPGKGVKAPEHFVIAPRAHSAKALGRPPFRQGKVSSSDLMFTSFALVTFELMGAPNENSSFNLGHSDE